MKYIVVLADGMADYALEELNNKTPLQYAETPGFNFLAENGVVGMVKTIPDGILPGSDTANLSVMGYDPKIFYSGRSPFEAISIGINFSCDDVTLRCNLITLSEEEPYEEKILLDHSADEITSEEGAELIKAVDKHLRSEDIKFFPGISYRNIMLRNNSTMNFTFTPPHDIIGKRIGPYLAKGEFSDEHNSMMRKSYEILKNHPINIKRKGKGLKPANSIWLWGEGRKPELSGFYEKYGMKGSVISAVDLIKGLGLCAGMKVVEVEGATGNVNTNYIGKAKAAIKELETGQDFVYIHIEAPDECGHRQEVENKVLSIERIDQYIVKTLLEELPKRGEAFKIMVLPDHPTPLSLRTHTSEPVPFVIYDSSKKLNNSLPYDEKSASESGIFIEKGHELMDAFIQNRQLV